MNLNHYNKQYCFVDNRHVELFFTGLNVDLERLRKEFLALGEYSFVNFATAWKTLRFASIFAYRYSVKEVMEFTQGVLHYAKGYIFSTDLSASVFGIYLVYAVYFKQTLSRKSVKFRMTLEECKEVKKILGNLKSAGYEEAVFVFIRLYENSGIHCVASKLEAGMEAGYRKYFGTVDDVTMDEQNLSPPFDPLLLDSFEDALLTYTKHKKVVFKSSDAFSTASDFVESMRVCLNQYGSEVDDQADDTKALQPMPSTSDIGVKRVNIKNKSYKRGSTTSPGKNKKEKKSGKSTVPKKGKKIMDVTSFKCSTEGI